ncbi:aminopeptidase, putative,metallo-peptidase, clan MA(E), family M1, putative [Trypanosoma cruzi marinkellei]|uniref:Aminopeptidase, putative,metallo-peptidase, clan MA(E), family M1, putative n=1 Tax=Trypanosoma cruzi marinkellei TaxID=85056 RepID=K2N476_TRYCR|nr:aminopeptidase, putative,metallo-peptidase, clan MA(E), family M1, putative [Trypanosoma cruzi marinkellei]
MQYWHPTHCTLQLNFLQSASQRDDGRTLLMAGDVYTGRSIIRYVRRSVSSTTMDEEFPALRLENKDGLHFHAITASTHVHPKAKPLVLHSIKVHPQHNDAETLKVLKVVESDFDKDEKGGMACDEQYNLTSKGGNPRGKKTKGKVHDANETERQGSHDSYDKQRGRLDPGSKHVFFEGAASMPAGSIVTLEIAFSGRIQGWDQGGIYVNDNPEIVKTTAAAAVATNYSVLLTHFEVALARLAFPCPDDSQCYRLIWHLQSLQLPLNYSVVVSNTAKLSEKAMGRKGTQHNFSSVGPLPAYVLAFAAFSGSMEVVEETLFLHGPSMHNAEGQNLSHSTVEKTIPLRIVASTSSGVTLDTLRQIAGTVREAVNLLENFFASPLPLQQMPFSNAFEWQEEVLTIVVAPTMPYISGMEHHGCIFLNEAIYRSFSRDGTVKGTIRRPTTEPNGTHEASRVALIVHELAHHWVGNTLGMPFVLKEGICLLLEQWFGDVIVGKPMRSIRPSDDSIVSDTAGSSRKVTSRIKTTSTSPVVVVDTEKGKEFTEYSYQQALNTLRDVVRGMGFNTFKKRMRHIYQTEVMGCNENIGMMDGRNCGDLVLAPYVTSKQFLKYMEASSEIV